MAAIMPVATPSGRRPGGTSARWNRKEYVDAGEFPGRLSAIQDPTLHPRMSAWRVPEGRRRVKARAAGTNPQSSTKPASLAMRSAW